MGQAIMSCHVLWSCPFSLPSVSSHFDVSKYLLISLTTFDFHAQFDVFVISCSLLMERMRTANRMNYADPLRSNE